LAFVKVSGTFLILFWGVCTIRVFFPTLLGLSQTCKRMYPHSHLERQGTAAVPSLFWGATAWLWSWASLFRPLERNCYPGASNPLRRILVPQTGNGGEDALGGKGPSLPNGRPWDGSLSWTSPMGEAPCSDLQ